MLVEVELLSSYGTNSSMEKFFASRSNRLNSYDTIVEPVTGKLRILLSDKLANKYGTDSYQGVSYQLGIGKDAEAPKERCVV